MPLDGHLDALTLRAQSLVRSTEGVACGAGSGAREGRAGDQRLAYLREYLVRASTECVRRSLDVGDVMAIFVLDAAPERKGAPYQRTAGARRRRGTRGTSLESGLNGSELCLGSQAWLT